MKRTLTTLLLAGICSVGYAQTPYVIYYAVDQMKTDAYIDQPFKGVASFELLYNDNISGTKQNFCYTFGCMTASRSNTYNMSTRVDNGYFYRNEQSNNSLVQTSDKAFGRYIGISTTRSMELSLKTYGQNGLACTEPKILNFASDLPQYFDLKYTSSCNQNTGVIGFNGYFKGTMAVVSKVNTFPILTDPSLDPLNIIKATATIKAPEFMISYFKPEEISWIQDGKVVASGYTITVGTEGTKGIFAPVEQSCGTHGYQAVVTKYNWTSSVLEINFRPNLKIGKDLLIEQPICNEAQSLLDSTKYNGYWVLGTPSWDREFIINFVKEDGQNDDQMTINKTVSRKAVSIDRNPFRYNIVEKFGQNVISCDQFVDSIKFVAPPSISTSDTLFKDILCNGDKSHLDLKIDGNTNVYTLAYGDSIKALQKGLNPNIPLTTGSRTYDFTISDANGCVYEKPLRFTAKEPSKLEATFSIVDAPCHDFNATVSLNAIGGTPAIKQSPYKYTYTPSQSDLGTATVSIKAGTKLTMSVRDAHGCEVNFSDTTLYNPADFILLVLDKEDNFCPKGQSASIQLAGNSDDKRYLYSYSKDGKTFVADPLFENLSSGIFTFYTKNQFGCLRDTAVVFTEPPLITITKTALDSVRCYGETNGSITLNVTGGTGNKKLWMDGGVGPLGQPQGLQPYTYDGLAGKTYKFHAQDSLGCRDSVAYDIGTRSNIRHTLAFFNPSCSESSDGELNIKNSGGVGSYQNEWLFPKGMNHYLTQTGLAKGTYILQSRDALGCSKTDTFKLNAPPALQVQLEGHPLICKGQSLDLDAGITAPKYEWTSIKGFKATTKVVNLTEADTYYLKVTNGFGCVGRDTFELKQSDTEFKAYFVVATNVVKGDTVVLVNYNGQIDSLVWNLDPSSSQRLTALSDFRSQKVVFSTLGEQEIGMVGYYKGCRDLIKRKILVIDPSERSKYDQSIGIKTSIFRKCGLFPNPNDGTFSVHLELNEDNVPAMLTLSSTTTGSVLKQLDNTMYPDGKIDFVEDLPEGSYVIHVKVRDEVVALRFLVAYD